MSKRIMDRRALFASGAAAALLAATGVAAGPAPQRGGRMRLALSGAARTDDWLGAGQGLFMQVARQGLIFDSLTEIAADGTLRGELATEWQGDDTARRWIFDLRREVTFHDGRPFEARDVVASLGAQGFKARAIGTFQVEVQCDQPQPDLPFVLSGPAHVILPADGTGADGNGTGLYRVSRFDPGRQILAERVEADWRDGQAGWFDRVELVSIPDEAVRVQALAECLVDGADVSDPDMLPRFADISKLGQAGVSTALGVPARIGGRWALDNLRAPERWWRSEGL